MDMPDDSLDSVDDATRAGVLGRLARRVRAIPGRYLLPASFVTRAHLLDLTPEEIASLEAITLADGGSQRFLPQLERRLKEDWRLYGQSARLFLSIIGFLVFATLPLWLDSLLTIPQSTANMIERVALGFMMPLFLVVSILLLRFPAHRATEWLFLAAFVIDAACVEAIRYVSDSVGQPVSPSISILIPVAVLAMARLPLSRSVVFVLAYLGVTIGAALWQRELTGALTTRWLLDGLILAFLLASAGWTRMTLRHQWALATLSRFKAYRDTLTMLPNRWAFQHQFRERRDALWRSHLKHMVLAVVDVDHFKHLNDSHGHAYGDETLIKVGEVLSRYCRHSTDIVARTGGDEFMLVMYDMELSAVRRRLSELLYEIQHLRIRHSQSPAGVVTCSAGAAVFKVGDHFGRVYHRADEMLYEAKAAGRNQFRVADRMTPLESAGSQAAAKLA